MFAAMDTRPRKGVKQLIMVERERERESCAAEEREVGENGLFCAWLLIVGLRWGLFVQSVLVPGNRCWRCDCVCWCCADAAGAGEVTDERAGRKREKNFNRAR